MHAPSLSDLEAMTDEELRALYDTNTEHVVVGLNFIRNEIALREQRRQTDTMLRLTWIISILTGIVTVATLVNVAVALGWL